MPLSPSFPDWLLKRDPTLAGALTNPIFLAFEERRVRRPRAAALADLAGLTIPMLVLLGFLILASVITATPFDPASLVWIGLVMIIWLTPVFKWLRRDWRRNRKGPRLNFLPLEVSRAIRPGIADGLAADLALLPYTTSMTLHAAILECRRLAVLKSGVLSVLLIGGLAWVIAHSIAVAGKRISPIDFANLAALAFVLPHLARLLYWAFARTALLRSWGILDAAKPPGVQVDPRPSITIPGESLLPWLLFAPGFIPDVVPLLGRASETQKQVLLLVVAFSALGCHRISRRWRRGFTTSLESMETVHPENLADILLETESMITSRPD